MRGYGSCSGTEGIASHVTFRYFDFRRCACLTRCNIGFPLVLPPGPIPRELGRLVALKILLLSRNELTGMFHWYLLVAIGEIMIPLVACNLRYFPVFLCSSGVFRAYSCTA